MRVRTIRVHKALAFLLTLMLVSMYILPIEPSQLKVSAVGETGTINILEIQPGPSYELPAIKSDIEAKLGKSVNITTMPVTLFNAVTEDINGKYDIIIVGRKTYTGVSGRFYSQYYGGDTYSKFATTATKTSNYGSYLSGDKEFYSGTDITLKAAGKLNDFINSNQLVIFDSGIFNTTYNTTNLYTSFNGNTKVKTCDTNILDSSGNPISTKKSDLLNQINVYNSSAIRKTPGLILTAKPGTYNGSNTADISRESLDFTMNITDTNTSGNLTVKLYLDSNGDGIFSPSESIITKQNLKTVNSFSISQPIPSNLAGLISWKIELTDGYGVKNYVTGNTAHKAITEQNMRVLQLLPNSATPYSNNVGSNLNLSTLSSVDGNNLLFRAGEFNITVTEMKIGDFNNSYVNKTYKVNGVSTILNGNYDMVVIGFLDSYADNNDITNSEALQKLYDFAITNKQSVMFTHDTIGYSTTSKGLTEKFKNILGQNAFATVSSKPSGVTTSAGLTRLALFNANYSSYSNINDLDKHFPDTKTTRKINDSALTTYPYVLGDIPVSLTHMQYLRLNMEDPDLVVAYTYKNDIIYNHSARTAYSPTTPEVAYHDYDAANDYYTYFKGNITFSGTGHSLIDSTAEKQMFVNTIFKASMGSNHAPTVKFVDLNENQEIAMTQDKLNFRILANDYEDSTLTAKIYIDYNGNGSYEEGAARTYSGADALTSGLEKDVADLTKGVPNSVTKFGIKVEVTDPSGALGTAEVHLLQKDSPILDITNGVATGYLKGDPISIPFTVNASAGANSLNTTYSNISVTTNMNSNYFNITGQPGSIHSLNFSDVTFSPQPDKPSQTSTLSGYATLPIGEANKTVDIDTSLSYKDQKTSTSITKNFAPISVTIRSETVQAHVFDKFGAAIPGISVNLINVSTGAVVQNSSSNADGYAVFKDVPSGTYRAEYDTLTDYFKDNSAYQEKNIDFSSPNGLTFEMPALYKGSFTVSVNAKSGNDTDAKPFDGQSLILENTLTHIPYNGSTGTGVNPSGTYKFENLPGGNYKLSCTLPTGYSVKEGSTLPMFVNINYTNADPTTSIDLYKGRINATVEDVLGHNVTGVTVKLLDSGSHQVGSPQAPSSKIAVFDGVTSGSYTLGYDNLNGYTPIDTNPLPINMTYGASPINKSLPKLIIMPTVTINAPDSVKAYEKTNVSVSITDVYPGISKDVEWSISPTSGGTIKKTGDLTASLIGKTGSITITATVTYTFPGLSYDVTAKKNVTVSNSGIHIG